MTCVWKRFGRSFEKERRKLFLDLYLSSFAYCFHSVIVIKLAWHKGIPLSDSFRSFQILTFLKTLTSNYYYFLISLDILRLGNTFVHERGRNIKARPSTKLLKSVFFLSFSLLVCSCASFSSCLLVLLQHCLCYLVGSFLFSRVCLFTYYQWDCM